MAAAPVPFLAELNLPAGIAVLLAPLPAVATVEDVTEEVFEGRLQYYEALRKINGKLLCSQHAVGLRQTVY